MQFEKIKPKQRMLNTKRNIKKIHGSFFSVYVSTCKVHDNNETNTNDKIKRKITTERERKKQP